MTAGRDVRLTEDRNQTEAGGWGGVEGREIMQVGVWAAGTLARVLTSPRIASSRGSWNSCAVER